MNDDNPTKDLTGSEKLGRILSRFDKLQERFGEVESRIASIEEDRERETRKSDTMLAAIQQLQEEFKEVKFELRRLNAVFEKAAGEASRH
jgi:chromosome segregation ATPase